MRQRARVLSITGVVAAGLCCLVAVADAQSLQSGIDESKLQYVICMETIPGPGVGSEFEECSRLSALGLGVDREFGMDDIGGGIPINIGVGDLRSIVVRKSVDVASVDLFKFALNGNSIGQVEMYAQEKRRGWPSLLTTFEVKLARAFVRSMSLDEEQLAETVEFVYAKIQVTVFDRDDRGEILGLRVFCWDAVTNTPGCSL